MYNSDRHDHASQPKLNSTGDKAMRARDRQRRERVMEMISKGELQSAEDYYHAAWIMNYGDTPEEAENAHRLALRSSEMGYRPARWLAAACYDRWQKYQGKPQKYGINYVYDGKIDRLWDEDPTTTDEERAAWEVPPLAEQLCKAEEANRHKAPLSENELKEFEANAPEWLRESLKIWWAEQYNPEEE